MENFSTFFRLLILLYVVCWYFSFGEIESSESPGGVDCVAGWLNWDWEPDTSREQVALELFGLLSIRAEFSTHRRKTVWAVHRSDTRACVDGCAKLRAFAELLSRVFAVAKWKVAFGSAFWVLKVAPIHASRQETPPTLLWKSFPPLSRCWCDDFSHFTLLLGAGGRLKWWWKTLWAAAERESEEKSEKSGIKPRQKREKWRCFFMKYLKKEGKYGREAKWMLSGAGRRWLNGVEWSPSTWSIFCLLILLFEAVETNPNNISACEKHFSFFFHSPNANISLFFRNFPKNSSFWHRWEGHYFVVVIPLCLREWRECCSWKIQTRNQLLPDMELTVYTLGFLWWRFFSSLSRFIRNVFKLSYEKCRGVGEGARMWGKFRGWKLFALRGSPENLIQSSHFFTVSWHERFLAYSSTRLARGVGDLLKWVRKFVNFSSSLSHRSRLRIFIYTT